MSYNKIVIVGNLGQDPEVKTTQNGTPLTTMSVATKERFKSKTGDIGDRTEWHRVVMFNRLAEIAGEYLAKGSQVLIEGKMQYRKWEDENGNVKHQAEIVADQMKMLGGKTDKSNGNQKTVDPGNIPF